MARYLIVVWTLFVVGVANAGGVSKCRGTDGKLYFTDKGCYNGAQHEGWNPNTGYVVDEGADARAAYLAEKAQQHAQSAMERADRESRQVPVDQPHRLSYDEELRRRNLQVKGNSIAATPAEKAAVKEEVDRIDRGVSAKYSREDQERRDNAMVGAGSINHQRGQQAVQELRSIGDKYDSPAYTAARDQREADARAARMAAAQEAGMKAQQDRDKARQQHDRDVMDAQSQSVRQVGNTYDPKPIYQVEPSGERVRDGDPYKSGSADCYIQNGQQYCH